jgi:hypothetical protein
MLYDQNVYICLSSCYECTSCINLTSSDRSTHICAVKVLLKILKFTFLYSRVFTPLVEPCAHATYELLECSRYLFLNVVKCNVHTPFFFLLSG